MNNNITDITIEEECDLLIKDEKIKKIYIILISH